MTLRAVTRRQGGGAHVQQVCTTPIMRSSFLLVRAHKQTHERVHSSADMHEHTRTHRRMRVRPLCSLHFVGVIAHDPCVYSVQVFVEASVNINILFATLTRFHPY